MEVWWALGPRLMGFFYYYSLKLERSKGIAFLIINSHMSKPSYIHTYIHTYIHANLVKPTPRVGIDC
jgi:hypothetical protein